MRDEDFDRHLVHVRSKRSLINVRQTGPQSLHTRWYDEQLMVNIGAAVLSINLHPFFSTIERQAQVFGLLNGHYTSSVEVRKN